MATTERKVDDSQALVKVLNEAMPDLKRLAPKYVNISRLMALALEAKMRNPLLEKCSITSVLNFCKKAAEWGTDRVGAGGVWPVPFWNKKTSSYDMTPIPDWRLLIEKAKKAKAIKHATAEIVREGDRFSYSRGMSPDLIHEPALSATGEVVAAYCVYTLPDGVRDFVVMAAVEVDKVRNFSKAKDDGPWKDWPDEMIKKTVVKRAMKLFEGASVELTALLDADNAVLGLDLDPPEPIAMPRAIEVATEEAKASREQQASEEKKAEPSGQAQAAKPTISEAQSKRLYAIAKGAGYTDDGIKTVLKQYGYEHSKDVCKSDYEAICNELSQPPSEERSPGEEG